MDMMYKFIGGPCDGEYHRLDSHEEYVDVRDPTPVRFNVDAEDEYTPPKIFRYTHRTFGVFPHRVHCYVIEEWTDIYILGRLIHLYGGRPE